MGHDRTPKCRMWCLQETLSEVGSHLIVISRTHHPTFIHQPEWGIVEIRYIWSLASSPSYNESYGPETFMSFFFIKIYIFIYLFLLCWFFLAACRLSLVAASSGYSSLQGEASHCGGFSFCGVQLEAHRLQ